MPEPSLPKFSMPQSLRNIIAPVSVLLLALVLVGAYHSVLLSKLNTNLLGDFSSTE